MVYCTTHYYRLRLGFLVKIAMLLKKMIVEKVLLQKSDIGNFQFCYKNQILVIFLIFIYIFIMILIK